MMINFKSAVPRCVVLALGLLSVMGGAIAGPVRVCGLPNSPTQQLDQKVIGAVFNELAMPYQIVDSNGEIGRHPASDTLLNSLLKTKCDVFIGVPIARRDRQLNGNTIVSPPYFKTSFMKFRMANQMAGTKGNGIVAVAFKSPGQFIAIEEKDPDFDVENTPDDVIKAVVSGKTQYGIAWYPSLLAYEQAHQNVRFATQRTHTNISNWNLCVIANDRNRALMAKISGAVKDLSKSGKLKKLITSSAGNPLAYASSDRRHASIIRAVFYPTGHFQQAIFRVTHPVAGAPANEQANFSADQIGRGTKAYAAHCAKCHGEQLQGNVGPALAGPGFAPVKNSPMTISGIFQYMTTNMPADKPGKLRPKAYADIMAFLLHKNGYQPNGHSFSPQSPGNDQAQFNSFVK